MIIKKKIWPENFNKVLSGEKNVDIRLADFKLNKGDILVLEEYNPIKKQYTGRTIKKIVKSLNLWNPTKAHTIEEIKKYGFYEIELG